MSGRKDKFLGLLIFLLILLSLEGAARLFRTGDYLDKIKAVLREDAELLWVQRTGLDTVFEGVPLRTNSLGFRGGEPGPKKRKRIIVMGASPSFGWGVEEARTYPALLARELADAGKDAEVINASVIGYSSWQGARLLERRVLAQEPDVVVFAYGVNDVDRYRFFRSQPLADADLPAAGPLPVAVSNLLARSVFVKAYAAALNRIFAGTPSACPPSPPERVGLEAYLENLSRFRSAARGRGFRLVVLTSPFLRPASHFRPSCGPGALALPAQASKEAVVKFAEANAACPASLRCAALFDAGRWERAAAAAELYGAYDGIQGYNAALRKLAAEERDLRLLDAAALLRERELFLEPGHDFVHFSEAGHERLARRLSGLLKEIL